jgi:hypothetical protein
MILASSPAIRSIKIYNRKDLNPKEHTGKAVTERATNCACRGR